MQNICLQNNLITQYLSCQFLTLHQLDNHLDEWYYSNNKKEYFKKYQDILIIGMIEEELESMEGEDEYMTMIKNEMFKFNESLGLYQLFTDEENR